MVQEELLRMLGAVLVSAGGEVPLDHVESLLREKFDVELQNGTNSHVTLEKYLLTNFSDICRVKRAADGHFVVRMLQLPSISHLLPAGYVEPEFEPLTTTELQGAPNPRANEVSGSRPNDGPDSRSNGVLGPEAKRALGSRGNGIACPQPNGIVCPRPNGIACPQPNGIARPQLNGIARPQTNGIARPQPNGIVRPQPNSVVRPQPNGIVRPQPNGVVRPQPNGVVRPQPNGAMRPQTGGVVSPSPNGTQITVRRGAPSPQRNVAPDPPPKAAPKATPILLEKPAPSSQPSEADPQPNLRVQSPQLKKVPRGNLLNPPKQLDRNVMLPAAAIKAPNEATPKPKFDTMFTKDDYQDDLDAATILANLENQLSEECSIRGIIEPSFKLTTWGEGFKEVFCVATWGSEKIQSHPGVFATEEGAKANVIKKMLIGMDEFAQKLMNYQSTANAEVLEFSPSGQKSDQGSESNAQETTNPPASPGIAQEEQLAQTNGALKDPVSEVVSSEPEREDVQQEESTENNEDYDSRTDVPDSVGGGLGQAARPALKSSWDTPNPALDALIMNHSPVDLEPRIDMEQPVSQGYLTHVSADGCFIVQVKGPGLAKWERQTFAFDPLTPTKEIIPFRWYVAHIVEGTDVDFFDRAMCISEKGPLSDDRGFVQLYFPDNGYESFVDPNMVFDLQNYEEINRVPVQGVPIHAIGLTGRTPVEELRTTHPPHNRLLFLPANKSNCYVRDCSADVPHVYLYDMDVKRVLC